MGFGTALAHLEEPGAAILAPPPGLLFGQPAFGFSVLLARVKRALARAGMDVPRPAMQVPPHNRTGAADGGRARRRGEGRPARVGRHNPLQRWRVRDGEGPLLRPGGAAAAGQTP